MHTRSALLTKRKVIRISGEDHQTFLQSLVSVDMRTLSEHGIRYALLLSPQGKFLHDFFLIHGDGETLMDVEAAQWEVLEKRLMLYRLKSKVTWEEAKDTAVMLYWGEKPEADAGIAIYADPRCEALGWRAYGAEEQMPKAEEGEWDAHRITLGIPVAGRDLIPDKSLPLEYGLEKLGAVDFTKGCYVGQEVTARTKYRATLRKALYRVSSHDGSALKEGAPVQLEGREVGTLLSCHESQGLAILRIEAVEKASAADEKLTASEAVIQAAIPGWAQAKAGSAASE